MTVAWIGCAVQFCATTVAVDDWPALMTGGLKVSELICTVPVHDAAEAAIVPTTATTLATTNRTLATAVIRRIFTPRWTVPPRMDRARGEGQVPPARMLVLTD